VIEARLRGAKSVMPVGIELDGQERGVVRPVLEERATVAMERGERVACVAGRAREQDHVVGALDHIDRVELHEAEAAHQRKHIVVGQWMR
jgi:hypothetical protein